MRIEYKESDTLNDIQGIRHGYFTKHGGVSSGIYASLNCAPSSDDSLNKVTENRWRALSSLGLDETKLFGLTQIHSTKVHVIDKKSSDDFPQGDALVSREKGITLSVLGADCAPILFADKTSGVIAAAHAGWKGAVSGIVAAVVASMCKQGATKENIHACIGPTIHQPSYEVREDFIRQLQDLSSFPTNEFLTQQNDKFYFDLPGYLLKQFSLSGISGENLALDTYLLKDTFFSFRRNTHQGIKEYGRQMSVIGLL